MPPGINQAEMQYLTRRYFAGRIIFNKDIYAARILTANRENMPVMDQLLDERVPSLRKKDPRLVIVFPSQIFIANSKGKRLLYCFHSNILETIRSRKV